MSKKCLIAVSVVAGIVVLAGLGVLIWWLVTDTTDDVETILLDNDGFGNTKYTAAFTRIRGVGDLFWWFFPSPSSSRPILLFLGGITGVPHSFILNFGEIGPLDFNLSERSHSLINDYNLLFMDGIIGTGFSQAENKETLPQNFEDIVDNIIHGLRSFYDEHEEYEDRPLYIFEQGDGSLIAVQLTIRLAEDEFFSVKIKGLFLGNPVISPATTLTKLGFYLEELAYVESDGRAAIEEFSSTLTSLVTQTLLADAFDQFLTIDEFIDENAGAVAVNLGHIVEILNKDSVRDYFGESAYYDRIIPSGIEMKSFMQEVIAPALGVASDLKYDEMRDDVIQALRPVYMESIVDKVEHILKATNVTVTIFNGNLDAVSNTPGQLVWVDQLDWPDRDNFTNSQRETMSFNNIIEGYFRQSNRFNFYWINVAGQSALLDNPVAVTQMLEHIALST